MEEAAARRAAEVLLAEHKSGVPFRPFPLRDGPATISDAYDIQDTLASFCRETPVFMFRRASSSIKPAQTGGDGPRLPGILTPIFVVISRRIHWTRGGHNDVQRISFRD